jgi:hypothetical protein
MRTVFPGLLVIQAALAFNVVEASLLIVCSSKSKKMSARPRPSEGGSAAVEGESAEGADGTGETGSRRLCPLEAAGGASGSRAVSNVPLPGTVAMLSGVMVSTGAALFSLLADAASPVEDATRFEQLMTGATIRQQSKAAVGIRGISHRGIAHLVVW